MIDINEMLTRLEAAEEECDKLKELNIALYRNSNSQVIHNARLAEENYALRAEVQTWQSQAKAYWSKITEMEQQEPVGTAHAMPGADAFTMACFDAQDIPVGTKFYTLPGKQQEINLSDPAVQKRLAAQWGYVPTPSVPDEWLRTIDEALVTAHIGVANAHDTYEQAKAKLDNLIGFNVDIATDPAVNGSWKLVPIEPTPEMLKAGQAGWLDCAGADPSWDVYQAMVKAAPEVK